MEKSSLGARSISVLSNSTLRVVVYGTTLSVYLNNQELAGATVSLSTGPPGIGGYGMTSPSNFNNAMVGHHDTVNPGALLQPDFDPAYYQCQFRSHGRVPRMTPTESE
jgi:hypothetical protein